MCDPMVDNDFRVRLQRWSRSKCSFPYFFIENVNINSRAVAFYIVYLSTFAELLSSWRCFQNVRDPADGGSLQYHVVSSPDLEVNREVVMTAMKQFAWISFFNLLMLMKLWIPVATPIFRGRYFWSSYDSNQVAGYRLFGGYFLQWKCQALLSTESRSSTTRSYAHWACRNCCRNLKAF